MGWAGVEWCEMVEYGVAESQGRITIPKIYIVTSGLRPRHLLSSDEVKEYETPTQKINIS